MQTLCQDLEQLEPRPIREPLGDGRIPALQATDTLEYRLQLTRAGWSNTAGLARPTLQRVGYRLDQDGLWRDHWPALDRTLVVEPVKVQMLDGVRSVSLPLPHARTGLDRSLARAANRSGVATSAAARPRSRSMLELEDWGEIRRLVEIAG